VRRGYLIVKEGDKEQRFDLDSETPCRIGRAEQNNIWLREDAVSRNHAMVEHSASGDFFLYDLGTRNGTFLNGKRVTAPTPPRHGDEIQIGKHVFRFVPAEASLLSEAAPTPGSMSGETVVTVRMGVVTVLVTDIRDYTELALRIGESRIAAVIGTFNRECSAVLEQMGSWEQKYIGDAIMAVWVHSERQSEMELMLSVLQSVSAMATIAAGLQLRFDLPSAVRLGAGINTGIASLGNLGGAAADHTALGDAVNKAFRFESATKELCCEVAFGGETRDILAKVVDVDKVAQKHNLILKGYTEPSVTFSLSLDALSELIDGLRMHGVRLPSDVPADACAIADRSEDVESRKSA